MAGKREAQKATTQAKLVGRARAMFQAQGYEAVSLRAVAKGTGMTTGAIFANFPGKAELYKAAMGCEAPDVAAFLERVSVSDHPLAQEAEKLRSQLLGSAA